MTADEREQLASLRSLVTNEFDHITKRLDSHSNDLRALAVSVNRVESKLDTHVAVETVSEPVKAEDRRSMWGVVVAVIGLIGSVVGGWIAGGHH
ncbi:MAG: hypothetical protein ABFD54_15110 [Armatimonadota bacterium]|nr:hypothetical protein [bacterium]